MILHSWLRACACLALMATVSTSLGGEKYGPVRSSDLGLEFRAPAGWIVRHLTENGESVVAITRELLDGFPRYHVGFSATSVNVERRGRKIGSLTMARALCGLAQKRGTATSECLESQVDGVTRVEWRVFYPPESPGGTATVGWAACLADEARDSLVRILFEAPESEWVEVESVAAELMKNVRRMRSIAEAASNKTMEPTR
jgi:hypothetical protein